MIPPADTACTRTFTPEIGSGIEVNSPSHPFVQSTWSEKSENSTHFAKAGSLQLPMNSPEEDHRARLDPYDHPVPLARGARHLTHAKRSMVPSKLRIVYANDDQVDARPAPPTFNKVTVRLEEVFPLLAEAKSRGSNWLEDFADDPITITSDLYEVLLAYQHHARRAA